MKNEELKTIIADHLKWLRGDTLGKRAVLSGAVLSGAVLSGAVLSQSRGLKYAQMSWTGHGECGRMLSAVELPEGLKLFCGCFSGSVDDLRAYIANGAEEYRESRTKTLEFVLSCF